MSDDRISGSAKNIGGQVEEGFGRVTGDEKTQLQARPSRRRAHCKTSTARPRKLRLTPPKLSEKGPAKPAISCAQRSRSAHSPPRPLRSPSVS